MSQRRDIQAKQLGKGQEKLTGMEPWCLSADVPACLGIGNNGTCFFFLSDYFLLNNSGQWLSPRTLKLGVVAPASNPSTWKVETE